MKFVAAYPNHLKIVRVLPTNNSLWVSPTNEVCSYFVIALASVNPLPLLRLDPRSGAASPEAGSRGSSIHLLSTSSEADEAKKDCRWWVG